MCIPSFTLYIVVFGERVGRGGVGAGERGMVSLEGGLSSHIERRDPSPGRFMIHNIVEVA